MQVNMSSLLELGFNTIQAVFELQLCAFDMSIPSQRQPKTCFVMYNHSVCIHLPAWESGNTLCYQHIVASSSVFAMPSVGISTNLTVHEPAALPATALPTCPELVLQMGCRGSNEPTDPRTGGRPSSLSQVWG